MKTHIYHNMDNMYVMAGENEVIIMQSARIPPFVPLTLRVLTILFGIAAIIWPILIGEVIVLLFGIFIFITAVGMFSALYAQEIPSGAPKWAIIIAGVLGLIIGVWAIVDPLQMGFSLYYLIGIWAIATGVLQLYYALKGGIQYRTLMAISAVISLLFGFLVLAVNPLLGWATLIQVTGIFAIIDGIIGFGFGIDPRDT